jgi:hypothetical protein
MRQHSQVDPESNGSSGSRSTEASNPAGALVTGHTCLYNSRSHLTSTDSPLVGWTPGRPTSSPSSTSGYESSAAARSSRAWLIKKKVIAVAPSRPGPGYTIQSQLVGRLIQAIGFGMSMGMNQGHLTHTPTLKAGPFA